MPSNHWPPWGGDPMMLLGRILERTEATSEDVRDLRMEVSVINRRLIKGDGRMDQMEGRIGDRQKQPPPPPHWLLEFLKEVASLKQWLSGALLVILFATSLTSPEQAKSILLCWLGSCS